MSCSGSAGALQWRVRARGDFRDGRSERVGPRALEQQFVEPLLCECGEWPQGARADEGHASGAVDEPEQVEINGHAYAADAEARADAPAEAPPGALRGRVARLDVH